MWVLFKDGNKSKTGTIQGNRVVSTHSLHFALINHCSTQTIAQPSPLWFWLLWSPASWSIGTIPRLR